MLRSQAVKAIALLIALATVPAAPAEEFVWQYRGRVIGRLSVPPGFTSKTLDYIEGIVTTLRYADGAFINLQSGGNLVLPMFQAPEHRLVTATDLRGKTIRVGRSAKSALCWREDNFKQEKMGGKAAVWTFPPNIGYASVPLKKRAEFDRALDSFSLETAGPTNRGR
ncbi:MAG TPA: hypothetical protein VMT32_02400 [Bryobacteraceae bacterium]|nr:hypothetical protein [Bryobacteraceae bacterium]